MNLIKFSRGENKFNQDV